RRLGAPGARPGPAGRAHAGQRPHGPDAAPAAARLAGGRAGLAPLDRAGLPAGRRAARADDGGSAAAGRRAEPADQLGHRPRDRRGLPVHLAVERARLAGSQRAGRADGVRAADGRPADGPGEQREPADLPGRTAGAGAAVVRAPPRSASRHDPVGGLTRRGTGSDFRPETPPAVSRTHESGGTRTRRRAGQRECLMPWKPDRALALGLAVLCCAVGLGLLAHLPLAGYFGLSALLVSGARGPWRTAAMGLLALVIAGVSGLWDHRFGTRQHLAAIGLVAAQTAVAIWIAIHRSRRESELRVRENELVRVRAVADVAQRALLPEVPTTIDGACFAARYLSAAEEATVGGDLYEVVATRHTIRVIIGDVR